MQTSTATAPAAAALGRYRLGRRLGTGGFGTVYAAVDERLGREVAVKVIPSDDRAPTGERARREALTAARLDHPAIVAVLDAGEEDGVRYLVSELVEGASLAELLAGEERISDRDALRVGLALLEALEHAHARGVVHRDVKPANLLVPDRGRVPAKLCDFGVAHLVDEPLTRTGDVVGTLAYMAPEQAEGRRVDHRCDLFSAALVVYEALAGRNPRRAGSPAATARNLARPVPSLARARPDLPEPLIQALDRALSLRPGERGSVAELADALADALPRLSDDGGTIARLPVEGPRLRLGTVHRRVLASAAAAGLAAALLAALDLAAPAWAPAAVAAGVALLPRVAWLAAAVALTALTAPQQPDLALVVGAAAALPALLLYRTGDAWSVPGLAPGLALVALTPVHAAVAGQARTLRRRTALGAIGGAWAALAEGSYATEPDRALRDLPWELVPVLGVAAAVLPFLVRGRATPADVVGAAIWGGALGVATQLPGPALLAAGLAVAARWLAGPVAQATPAILEDSRPAGGG